jgi:hypothetical protein
MVGVEAAVDTQHPAGSRSVGNVVLRFRPARPAPSGCGCELRLVQRTHHDRLLHVETDFAEAVDLVDVATRWREGRYEARWVHPGDWELFAAGHHWNDPDKVRVLFRLAADLALGDRSDCLAGRSDCGALTFGPGWGDDPDRLITDEQVIACEL